MLNDKQRSVLRWVADGSPDGVMEGYHYRVSAAALRSRGLLKITGRGPTWHARLTELGEGFLARLDNAQGASEATDEAPPHAKGIGRVRKRTGHPTRQASAGRPSGQC